MVFVRSDDGNHFEDSIPDFRPDDFTVVSYNKSNGIRIIREDSPYKYTNHTSHKDFISLIVQMKLALSKVMRTMIKYDLETWHNQLIVIGITSDKERSHLYSIHCEPKSLDEKILLSNFTLTYIDSYKHNVIEERIQLLARIITSLIYPQKKIVNSYLTTQLTEKIVSSIQKQKTNFPLLYMGKTIQYDSKFEFTRPHSIIKKCTINGDCYFVKYVPPKYNKHLETNDYNFFLGINKRSNYSGQ